MATIDTPLGDSLPGQAVLGNKRRSLAAKSRPATRGASSYSLILLALAGILGYFQGLVGNGLLVLVITGVLVYEFQKRLDHGVPLMHIAALLACSQWLVGAYWSYHGNLPAGEMGMQIPEREYFHFALPGTACFVIALLYFCRNYDQRKLIDRIDKSHFLLIGLLLNGIALVGELAGRVLPGQLAFACFLVAQLRYVGCLYILCSLYPWRLLIAAVCMIPLLLESSKSAMFHDLLLWSGIVFCCWFSTSRRRFHTKVSILAAGLFVAFTIQAIKGGYREKTWHGENTSLTEEIVNFWRNSSHMDWDTVLANAMIRLNQGWIISAVMAHVPAGEPFSHGDTITDAVQAAVLFRFIKEDKAMAGGRHNFTKFTGLYINESTSMNVSLLGEGYGNFGVEGAIFFMGIMGAVMSLSFTEAIRWTRKYPTFIFWVPLIYYQAVKAETDLTEVLNQVVKGGIVAILCFILVHMYWPDRRIKKSTRKRLTAREPTRAPRGASQVATTGQEKY